MASDANTSRREKLQQDIQTWLSPPDPRKNHNIATSSRHPGTAAWFVEGATFSKWKSSGPSSLLWIHGKPGSGKSVFCSTIIEEIDTMQKSGHALLAFFYCDFREEQKKVLRGLLSSLLVQLCRQSDSYCDMLSKFYLEHEHGSQDPKDKDLARCLNDLMEIPERAPVYLILDALDECPNTFAMPSPREDVLKLVEQLIDSHHANLRICVTSRPETDIKAVLVPLTLHSVSLHDEIGHLEDIENYIKSVVNTDPRNRRWTTEDRQLVIDVLTKRADGMFRWVYCQIVYLRGCHPGRIRHAVAELPETLDETYERTLREINKADSELADRLFQCVAVASRPLHVEELAEFLAFDFDAGTIPTLNEGWRLEDPIDAVVSTCSTLLSLVNFNDSSVIQFSHSSVKEFLTSSRFADKCDPISRRYHISMTPAHTLVAQACLGVLLHLDDNITEDSLQKFPLAEYAAEFWVDHAHFEGISQNTEEAMKQLFDASKSHFAIWLWIYDPYRPQTRYERVERPLPPKGTPLHYASFCCLHPIVKALAIEHAQDVNSRGFRNEATPLHLASRNGYVERVVVQRRQMADTNLEARGKQWSTPIRQTPPHQVSPSGSLEVACLLIELGADMEARDKHGSTPLHEASKSESVEIARLLIEHGAATTVLSDDGLTPLHQVSRAGNVDIARLLVEHGADVAAQDKSGTTPLHDACSYGNVGVACMLVERGAPTAPQDKDGATPLHHIMRFGSIDIGRLLIEHGADLAVQNNFGGTPLRDALLTGSLEIARLFIEKGADLTAQDQFGNTLLHDMSFFGFVEQARLLIEQGADMTAQNKNGWTPLHMVSRSGNVDIARLLVEHGADVAAQDGRGNTPLHDASFSGSVEVARLLIEHDAVTTAKNTFGYTPLQEASLLGNADITNLLIEHGADPTDLDEQGWTLPPVEALEAAGIDLALLLPAEQNDESDEDDFYSLSDVSSF